MKGRFLAVVVLACLLAAGAALAAGGCGKKKAQPELDSLAPSSGEAGIEVAIGGKYLGSSQGKGTLRFGDKQPEIKSWSDTSITFKVPSDLKEGEYEVAVETEAGKSNALIFRLSVEPAPKKVPNIASIQPSSGASGAQVTIYGKDFVASRGNGKMRLGPVEFEVTS